MNVDTTGKTLSQFVDEVNQLDRARYGESHLPLEARMLKWYWENGHSPQETLGQVDDDAAAELHAESRMS